MSGLAVTEKGNDVARLRGRVLVTSVLAALELGSDTFGGASGTEPGSALTLMELVSAALADLAPGGAWPGRNTTQPVAYPYLTFFRVIKPNEITLDGPTGMQPSRIQIDAYSLVYAEASRLAARARARMLERFAIGSIDEQDFPPDPDVDAHRCSGDYNVWSTAP